MPPQYIYVMKGLGKVHQPDHVVLKDIWLSFLPGAKIGVLGVNGAGKSSLLRIMAGEDTELPRRSLPRPGQHRRLSAAGAAPRRRRRPCAATSRKASPKCARCSTRYDAINAQLRRRPVARGDGQGPRRTGQGPGPHRRDQRLGPRLAARARDGRAALPAAATPTSRTLSGGERRRVALCRLLLQAAGPAAARRTDQPSRRRIGGVARTLPQGLRGHRRRRHARSLLPRQRRRLDPRARSRQRHSVGRQLLVLARAEAARLALEEKSESRRQRTLQRELDWIRMSPRARQAKGKARLNAYEELLNRGRSSRRSTRSRSTSRPARASATSSSKRRTCARATATTC